MAAADVRALQFNSVIYLNVFVAMQLLFEVMSVMAKTPLGKVAVRAV